MITTWKIKTDDAHKVRHALCVAAERFEENAAEIKTLMENPPADAVAGSTESLKGLVEQFERQGKDTRALVEAFDAATEIAEADWTGTADPVAELDQEGTRLYVRTQLGTLVRVRALAIGDTAANAHLARKIEQGVIETYGDPLLPIVLMADKRDDGNKKAAEVLADY